MSASEKERLVLETRRRALPGLSMHKACRKLVFEADQNDRDEDASSEEATGTDYHQEHLQRQIQRWGFDFTTGQPLENSRLEWEAVSGERVAPYYRETCLRSPPRRNPRIRRNIMSARTSESTEHYHPQADNRTVGVAQVNASRLVPENDVDASRIKSETETASVAVSTSSVHCEKEGASNSNYHGCNNGICNNFPSTSVPKMAQSHIDDFFNQRKRRRSISEGKDAKRAKTQDHMERPRSAPAAVATSS